MSYETETPDLNERAQNRRVQETLNEMHAARQEFLRAHQAGMLSERLHLKFQSRILDLVEELRPYKNRAQSQWDDATNFDEGLDVLARVLVPRKVTQETDVGFGREKMETHQEPQTLNPHHLREISEELDAIAHEIGFEPAPDKDPDDVHGGQL